MASFKTVLIPTSDIAASRELYRNLLGTDPSVDESYYVGFDVDGQHIGLNPAGAKVLPHLHVADMAAALQAVTSAGGSVVEDPKDVGGGRQVAVVRDASDAEIGLISDSA